jgi:hypothetical protein
VLTSFGLHTGSFHGRGRDTVVNGGLRRVEIYGGASMAAVAWVLLFDLRPRVHGSGDGAGPPLWRCGSSSTAVRVLLLYDSDAGSPPRSTMVLVLLLDLWRHMSSSSMVVAWVPLLYGGGEQGLDLGLMSLDLGSAFFQKSIFGAGQPKRPPPLISIFGVGP